MNDIRTERTRSAAQLCCEAPARRITPLAVLACIVSLVLAIGLGPAPSEAWADDGLAAATGGAIGTQAAKPKLNKKAAKIRIGKSLQLKVKNAGNKTVKWKSSKGKIAKVTKKGKVKALKVGTAKITAKVGKKKLTCKITVLPKNVLKASKAKVVLKQKTTTLDTGAKVVNGFTTAKVKIKFAHAKKYKIYCWSDSGCVEPSLSKKWNSKTKTLTIKGVRPGTATVTISNGYNNDELKIKVTVKPAFSVRVMPAVTTESSYAIDGDGYGVVEHYLPVFVTNNTKKKVTLDSGVLLFLPDVEDNSVNYDMMVFKNFKHGTDLLGSSDYLSLTAITEDLLSDDNTIVVKPGKEGTIYAYVGTSEIWPPLTCGVATNIRIGGTKYFVVSDAWGYVQRWSVITD